MLTVRVDLGLRSYDVLVGPGVVDQLPAVVPTGVRRAAVVTQAAVEVEVDCGVEQAVFTVDAGESAKTMATVERLCRDFTAFGLTRNDLVVAVGGGVVTDTAGFAAAVYHRGVAVIHVATTLLAQVDAAIGGKTGVNLPEGKNLVGAFWQPAAVLCDTSVLDRLPRREFVSGLGEMAKYHFLGATDLDDLPLPERVARCVALKADFVAADEREGDRRALLNYGHTLAHALEIDGGFDLRHGEAVAIGLVFAARLAHALGRIDAARLEYHEKVVDTYGLPSALPAGADPARLLELMRRDKKSTGGLAFVLDGPHGVELLREVDAPTVLRVLREMP